MDIDKIVLGDCYELIKELPKESVDLIITDPPYDFHDSKFQSAMAEKRTYVKEMIKAKITNSFNFHILDDWLRASYYGFGGREKMTLQQAIDFIEDKVIESKAFCHYYAIEKDGFKSYIAKEDLKNYRNVLRWLYKIADMEQNVPKEVNK